MPFGSRAVPTLRDGIRLNAPNTTLNSTSNPDGYPSRKNFVRRNSGSTIVKMTCIFPPFLYSILYPNMVQ